MLLGTFQLVHIGFLALFTAAFKHECTLVVLLFALVQHVTLPDKSRTRDFCSRVLT